MQDKIERDLKAAMLAGEKSKVETLKGLKSALQYEAVSLNAKPEDLTDEQRLKVLAREAKKRQEAADLYQKAGEQPRAEAELYEKSVIEVYLPAQLDEAEVKAAVDEEIAKLSSPSMQDMGKIIGAVKAKLGPSADGSTIARTTKELLS